MREEAAKERRRTSHVRFSTPAAPAYVPKATPSQTKGVNSCNAGTLRTIICQGGMLVRFCCKRLTTSNHCYTVS